MTQKSLSANSNVEHQDFKSYGTLNILHLEKKHGDIFKSREVTWEYELQFYVKHVLTWIF